ncbi:MAG: protease pro-enzyme activation domain-containing protein, partial [Candidatus Angelobacter sp.]
MQEKSSQLFFRRTLLLFSAAVLTLGFSANSAARELPHHTAKFVASAPDLGAANPAQVITVKVVLQKSDSALADLIQQLHDPTSPKFQQWLTPDQFKAQFGASDNATATVMRSLTGHNLKVIHSDNRAITVQGTVGDIQSAFHTQIHEFKVDGKVVRANISNPVVDEPAGSMVAAISGLTQATATPYSRLRR